MCVVDSLDICSYLVAHLRLPVASPDLVVSVSRSEAREMWLLKINQSEVKIGHRLSPVGSQKKRDICSRVRGERRIFASVPFRFGLDTSSGSRSETSDSFSSANFRFLHLQFLENKHTHQLHQLDSSLSTWHLTP